MTNQDLERFGNALGVVCEVFGKKASPLLSKAYFAALNQFEIEQVEKAFSRAITECPFFPKPVELIGFINGEHGSIEDRALVEAGRVLEAIKVIGGHASVSFGDPVTNAVIAQGFNGWSQLCSDLKTSGAKWFLKDFARIYAAYSRQGVKHHGHLAGRTEIDNNALGFTDHIPEPVLIAPDRLNISDRGNSIQIEEA